MEYNFQTTLANIENLLLAQKKILTVKDLCSYTGFSSSFVYSLTSSRRIPFSRPNGKILIFEKQKIDAWLLSNPISPVEDIEQEAIDYITDKAWKGYGI